MKAFNTGLLLSLLLVPQITLAGTEAVTGVSILASPAGESVNRGWPILTTATALLGFGAVTMQALTAWYSEGAREHLETKSLAPTVDKNNIRGSERASTVASSIAAGFGALNTALMIAGILGRGPFVLSDPDKQILGGDCPSLMPFVAALQHFAWLTSGIALGVAKSEMPVDCSHLNKALGLIWSSIVPVWLPAWAYLGAARIRKIDSAAS